MYSLATTPNDNFGDKIISDTAEIKIALSKIGNLSIFHYSDKLLSINSLISFSLILEFLIICSKYLKSIGC